jgi:hypothetical protein
MRSILLAFVVAALHAGCKDVECGPGTIERGGTCEPSDTSIDTTKCGPNTMAVGDQCLPKFEPTVCDPATTDADLDPTTNVTTCIGTGGGGCGAALACPQPSAGKQTICGQIFDFETGDGLAAATASGTRCDPATPATTGPCAVRITAYDAVAFSSNPNDPNARLAVGDNYLDDCGRYRLTDVTPPPATPFIALGMDDIDPTKAGPMGVTNAAGIATGRAPDMATKDVELFAVSGATSAKWQSTGGPPINGGIYAMVFRAKRAPSKLPQADVTVIKSGAPTPGTDHYFVDTDVTRERIDATAIVTGANGTALVTNATLSDVYTGTSALPAECRWSVHVAATVPFVVFVQVARPVNQPNMTCPL